MQATAKGFVLKGVPSQIFCDQKWVFSWNRHYPLHHHSRTRTTSSSSQPQVSTSVSHSSPCSCRWLGRLVSPHTSWKLFHCGSTGRLSLSSAAKRRLHGSFRWRVLRIELYGLEAAESHDWSLGSWHLPLRLGSSRWYGRGPLSSLALCAPPLHRRRAPSHRDST